MIPFHFAKASLEVIYVIINNVCCMAESCSRCDACRDSSSSESECGFDVRIELCSFIKDRLAKYNYDTSEYYCGDDACDNCMLNNVSKSSTCGLAILSQHIKDHKC